MVASGKVIGWRGNTVIVRLSDGRTITARANGRRYRGVGSQVHVAIDKRGRAVLI